jgi:hypothetical protein
MADQERLEIIRNNPIGGGLELFLAFFSSLCESKDIPCSGEALDQLDDEGKISLTLPYSLLTIA